VENRLHFGLDAVMNEDQARNRRASGPENLAILCPIALNLATREKSKISKRRKFIKAGWSNAFPAKLIARFCNAIALRL
jgi:hypothetical protein